MTCNIRNKTRQNGQRTEPEIKIPTSYYWPTWRSLLVEERVSGIEVEVDEDGKDADEYDAHAESQALRIIFQSGDLLLEGLHAGLVEGIRGGGILDGLCATGVGGRRLLGGGGHG